MATQVTAQCCKKGISASNKMVAICILLLCTFSTRSISIQAACLPIFASFSGLGVINNRPLSKEIKVKGDVDETKKSREGTNYDPRNSTDVTLLASIAEITSNSAVVVTDQLTYMQTMTAGALSRTMAQTLMHPANTYKTLL